jgi:small-conductance mechanosensitive channel
MINSPFAFTCLYPNVEDTKMNSKNKLDKRIHEMCKIKILMDDVDNYDANNEQNEQLYVKEKEVSDMQQNLYRLELELKGLEEQEEKEDEEMVGSSDSSQNKRKRTVD